MGRCHCDNKYKEESNYSKKSCGNCKCYKKKDKLPVGAYTIDTGGFPGNLCFNKGGTVHGGTGLDINLPNPFSQSGSFGLTWTGEVMEKKCKNVKILMTTVLTNKSDIGPSVPFVRVKIAVDAVFSKHFKSFEGTFTSTFYNINDIHLENPIQEPIVFPIVGFKLK
jgi:hypothetical protein